MKQPIKISIGKPMVGIAEAVFDVKIQPHKEELKKDVSDEKTARENADSALRADFASEKSRVGTDAQFDSLKLRSNADTVIGAIESYNATRTAHTNNVSRRLGEEIDRSKAADKQAEGFRSDYANLYHKLRTDSEGYVYQEFPANQSSESQSDSDRLMNHNDGKAVSSNLLSVYQAVMELAGARTREYQELQDVVDGKTVVGKSEHSVRASHDEEGNILKPLGYVYSVRLGYDSNTGVVTITGYNQNGAQVSSSQANLPSEMVFTDSRYDSSTKELVFTQANGKTVRVPIGDLVDTYSAGEDSEGITQVEVRDHKVYVSIRDGSIPLTKFTNALTDTLDGYAKAEAARVANENQRIANENERIANEQVRQSRPYLFVDSEGYISIDYGNL